MLSICVRDVMIPKVISVLITAPVSRVEEIMRRNKIRHITVVDKKGRLWGVISERELYKHITLHVTPEGRYLEKSKMDEFILFHIMVKNPITVKPDDPLVRAVGIMAYEKVGCLPVMDEENNLVGIITPIDVLKVLYRALGGHR